MQNSHRPMGQLGEQIYSLVWIFSPSILTVATAALNARVCSWLWSSSIPEDLTVVMQIRSFGAVVVVLAYALAIIAQAIAPKIPRQLRGDRPDTLGRAMKRRLRQLCRWLNPIISGALWGLATIFAFWLVERIVAFGWSASAVPGPITATLKIKDVTVVAVSISRALYGAHRIVESSVDWRRFWKRLGIHR